ncbi:hypothetical protein [Nonomuraea sp. NPDC049784]|uniref:hypothetical protein n=1 Tax=Nonomuraea sp. NPDC049784 TaxID=3154361 RepID=UPI0033CF2492
MALPKTVLRAVLVAAEEATREAAEEAGVPDMAGWVSQLRQDPKGGREVLVVTWMEDKPGFRGGLVEHGPAWLPMTRIRWIDSRDLAALEAAMTPVDAA